MSSWRWLLASIVWLCLCVPAYARSTNEAVQNNQNTEVLTRLPNGLTVYVIRDTRFPLVCTRLYVNTGSANESAAQAGISHVLEHMVFKGTDHRPKGKVAQDVESLGGYLNAATSFDKTWYLTDMPKAHWKVGLDVVKDMAFGATLDQNELRAEQDVIVSELQRGEDSPEHKLFEEMQIAALKHSPYGRPIIGFEPTIRAVTHETLAQYRDFWYQPQNMSLLVAGDIEPAEVLAYATTLFGDLRNNRELPAQADVDLAAAPDTTKVKVTRGPWKKVYLGFAFPAPSMRDLRSVDLDVLCYLLSGDATSRLYRKYKYETKLVDSISVDNMNLARAGMLGITVQLDPANVSRFFTEFTRDLAKLSTLECSAEERMRAVFNIEDSFNRAGETLTGLAAWKASLQFQLGGPLAESNIRERLKTQDTHSLQTTIATWLTPKAVRVRVLAPENATLPDFSAVLAQNWPESAGAKTKAAQFYAGKRETIALANGCSLVLIPDTHAPYLSLTMAAPGGNALLSYSEQGLATLVASLLTDGCGDLSAQAMEAYLAKRAFSMSASAGRQVFSLQIDGPSRFARDLYDIVRLAVTKPRFEQGEIDRELHFMSSALKEREDQPMRYLFAKIGPLLYPRHPYGYDELGNTTLLSSFTRESVTKYWQKQREQPWVITVVGSFVREEVLAFAKELSEHPTKPALSLADPSVGKEKNLTLHLPGRAQAHLLHIFPTVPLTHKDAPALLVLSHLLSGQSGLLFSAMRDQEGLGYTVTSFVRSYMKAGALFFYIGTVPEKIEQAKQGFAKVIETVCTSPRSQEELTSAVNRLYGDYVRGHQSLHARSSEASQNTALGLPLDFRRMLLEKAKAVTPEELMAVAKKYCTEETAYTVTLMP